MSLQTKPDIHGQNESIAPENNERRKPKRKIQDEEEAAYILDDLRSGNRMLYCTFKKSPEVKVLYLVRLDEGAAMLTYGITGRVKYYHISCFERIIPELADLVRDDSLEMDGWIAAPLDSKVTIESSTKAIQDWFQTTMNGREIGASSTLNTSSRIQESQLKDAVFVKECQSLKSRGKWIIPRKPICGFVESIAGPYQWATAH
ncbi:hypothetical protein CNMCM8980_002947 [Aspergillus fumigatiaffinis]|nr:hypothetical protein CNMCM8980_002947 [Aspergillus fumigatiaffinis]